jgi:hypothetical protein
MEILTKRTQGMSFKAYREHLKAQTIWIKQRIKYGPPALKEDKPSRFAGFRRMFAKRNYFVRKKIQKK